MREIEVLGEYVVALDHESPEVVLGHIHHVKRNAFGGQVQVPVGYFSAHLEPGDDLWRRHWGINLFLRSQVRYDPESHETTVVANPERQAGADPRMLKRLLELRDGQLPFYHPSLPNALGELLLRETSCTEPAIVHVQHYAEESFVQFGEVFHED